MKKNEKKDGIRKKLIFFKVRTKLENEKEYVRWIYRVLKN